MCCGMIQVWYKCHGYSTWLSLMCWGEATVDCFVGVSLGIALWCAAVSQSAHHISSTVLLCYHHFSSVFHQSFDRLSPCVLRGLVKAELPHACAFHHTAHKPEGSASICVSITCQCPSVRGLLPASFLRAVLWHDSKIIFLPWGRWGTFILWQFNPLNLVESLALGYMVLLQLHKCISRQ